MPLRNRFVCHRSCGSVALNACSCPVFFSWHIVQFLNVFSTWSTLCAMLKPAFSDTLRSSLVERVLPFSWVPGRLTMSNDHGQATTIRAASQSHDVVAPADITVEAAESSPSSSSSSYQPQDTSPVASQSSSSPCHSPPAAPRTSEGQTTPLPPPQRRPSGTDIPENAALAHLDPCLGNSVLLANRFLTGPDWLNGVGTLLLVTVPSILADIFIVPYYFEELSSVGAAAGAVVPYLLLQPLTVVFLLLTVFSDPGIIPKQKDFRTQRDANKGENRFTAPKLFDVVLGVLPTRTKFCGTCNVFRPLRTTHCSFCDVCVMRFDHHCPWVGNCIGENNYRTFFRFVLSVAILTVYTIVLAILQYVLVVEEKSESESLGNALWETIKDKPVTAVLIVYCCLLVWFTVGLLGYHTYLCVTRQSTYEQIKGFWDEVQNPYSRGPLGNLFAQACATPFPSKFHWRSFTAKTPSGLATTDCSR